MPGGYIIDTERRLVITRAWGEVTDRMFIEHISAVREDPAFSADMGQIGDLRDITKLSVTPRGVQSVATLSPFGRGSRRALIVSGDVAYGMGRMYSMLRPSQNGDEFTVVRTLEEACAWVGFPDDLAAIEATLRRAPPTFEAPLE